VTPDADKVKLREDAVAWREVEDEIVALDLASSEYVSVNRSGAVIWPLLVEGTTTAECAGRLVDEYGLDSSDAARDVDQFLEALAARNLLETS
jgi:Coenzyme PQQ synthesis protein D (PqqD)